jgi:dipeptidyl aminopeptidase/acylaminoacyl peptidase
MADKRHQFYLYCRQKGFWPLEVAGHDPRIDKKWFAAYEPVHNVTSTYPPTLLLHGQSDTDVPYQQSVQMAEKLKQQGVEYLFIADPAWGHGFDGVGRKDSKVAEALDRLIVFLKKHLLCE